MAVSKSEGVVEDFQCQWVVRWHRRRGGQQLLSQFMISDQRLHPPHIPLACLSRPLRLIKLDQDDTNNWLKLGPVCSPNDPYLTPFVAMVSLFPRRRSIWNGLPWPRHKRFSPIPRWTQQPADIMRVTERLHFSQMCGKLSVRWLFMATSFHPFFFFLAHGPPGRQRGGSRWGTFVWNVLYLISIPLQKMIYFQC